MTDEKAHTNRQKIEEKRNAFDHKIREIYRFLSTTSDYEDPHALRQLKSLISDLERQELELTTLIITNPHEKNGESVVNVAEECIQAIKIRTQVTKLGNNIKSWKQHGQIQEITEEDSPHIKRIQSEPIDQSNQFIAAP